MGNMELPTILNLPPECTDGIFRALPLQEAVRLGQTCKHLHRAMERNFSGLATVLSFSHSNLTDTDLRSICMRAKCRVRALSIAGCDNLTFDAFADLIRCHIGSSLLYLDISACNAEFIDDAALATIAPFLPNLRVLRMAHSPQITQHALEGMHRFGFGANLRVLDLSFSPEAFSKTVKKFPELAVVIAPGTRFERNLLETGMHPNVDGNNRDTNNFVLFPYSTNISVSILDIWTRIEADDVAALQKLFNIFTNALTSIPPHDAVYVDTAALVAHVPYAYITACNWNKQCDRALRNSRRNMPRIRAQPFLRTTLIAFAVSSAASRIARELVFACGVNPLEGREDCPIVAAILAAPYGPPGDEAEKAASLVVPAISPRARLSFVQPVAVALLVLSAARRNVEALDALLPTLPHARPESREVLTAALHAVFDPPSKICFPTASVADGVWTGPWIPETGFPSSWISNTNVNTEARLPNLAHKVDRSAQSADLKMRIRNTGRVVELLLARGAPYEHNVVLRAAELGEWDAMRVLLFHGAEGRDLGNVVAVRNSQIIIDRLFPTDPRECTVLVAASKCKVPVLAQRTVGFVLDLLEAIECRTLGDHNGDICELRSSPAFGEDERLLLFPISVSDEGKRSGREGAECPPLVALRSKHDENSATALVTVLDCGDYGVARLILEKRPGTLRKLVRRRSDAIRCIHGVARLVGRGDLADADLVLVGRNFVAAGIEYKGESVGKWLSEELLDSSGRSALHYASGASDPTFARILLRNGANVNGVDADGAVPLSLAVEAHSSRASLETLLRAGAHVNGVDKRGRSALHRAAESRNGSAAAALLRWGADPMTTDVFGVAPAHIDNDLLHRASLFAQCDHEGTLPFDRMEQRMDADGKLLYYTDSDHEET